jgi:hypothetical protein
VPGFLPEDQPPLLAVIKALMGADFVFHYLHSDRHAPDQPGKDWHHDIEQHFSEYLAPESTGEPS